MPVMRLVILLVAAGAAIAAAMLVRGMQSEPVAVQPIQTVQPAQQVASKRAAPPPPTQSVLVATEDIRVGTFLTPEHFSWQPYPESANTTAFYVDTIDPNAINSLIGAVTRIDMMAGEPFTTNKVVHPGSAGFMSAILTPGMRAVSFQISADFAAGGFIFPGDRVDVYAVYEVTVETPQGEEKMKSIDVIFENIRVLAIDGYYRPIAGGEGGSLVGSRATVEMTPSDSMVLVAAEEEGDLAVVLRSVADVDAQSGVTPRWRNFRRAGYGAESSGVRVFAGGQAHGMAVAPVGSAAAAESGAGQNGYGQGGYSQAGGGSSYGDAVPPRAGGGEGQPPSRQF